MKSFKIFKYKFLIEISSPKSIWYHNIRETNDIPNQRMDHLFSINRVYARKYKKYMYTIYIGRVAILFANTEQ